MRSAKQPGLLPIDVDDIVLINLQRAVQAAMDLASHVVAAEGYGLPDAAGATFVLLEKNGVIDSILAGQLQRMVGFRNIAVHEYQAIDPAIIEAIASQHLEELRQFAGVIVQRFAS